MWCKFVVVIPSHSWLLLVCLGVVAVEGQVKRCKGGYQDLRQWRLRLVLELGTRMNE